MSRGGGTFTLLVVDMESFSAMANDGDKLTTGRKEEVENYGEEHTSGQYNEEDYTSFRSILRSSSGANTQVVKVTKTKKERIENNCNESQIPKRSY